MWRGIDGHPAACFAPGARTGWCWKQYSWIANFHMRSSPNPKQNWCRVRRFGTLSFMSDWTQQAFRTTALELAEAENELERWQRRVTALRQIKAGLESYLAMDREPPEMVGVDEGGNTYSLAFAPLRGQAAVRAVLQERAGTVMTVPEIADEIVRRGWIDEGANALDATRTSVGRAVKSYRQVRRVGHGQYVYENVDGPTEAGPSPHLPTPQEGGDSHAPVSE